MNQLASLSGADPSIGQVLEKAILIGKFQGRRHYEHAQIELEELQELARTLGTAVVETQLISLREINPATFLGKGIVDDLKLTITAHDFPAVLVNDALTPRQQRNLEQTWNVPVLDRTEVILAIFAKRARTAEGRVQIEMAQLEHLMPRLAGGWRHLERQRGGIGIRGGAGEQQIEVDRRLIGQRLKRLRQKLKQIERQRSVQRAARTRVPLTSCALVGYTNAGKSTLLNRLTNSQVFADDLLFATLDPTSRLVSFASGRKIILTDTVGFIQNLPTELIEAFAATLEEVRQANLLAVVVDASHPDARTQLTTVLQTLSDMVCTQPAILVLSKIDRLTETELHRAQEKLGNIVGSEPISVSASQNLGLRELKNALDKLAITSQNAAP